jgi:hypothetical protein
MHDEAWQIAADETRWTWTQIECVLARIAFAEAQLRIERAWPWLLLAKASTGPLVETFERLPFGPPENCSD